MLTINSDIKVCFEQLNIKFQSLVDIHKKELETLTANAIKGFDFETAIDFHVKNKLSQGLDRAFEEIDISDKFKQIIGNEIESKLAVFYKEKEDNE